MIPLSHIPSHYLHPHLEPFSLHHYELRLLHSFIYKYSPPPHPPHLFLSLVSQLPRPIYIMVTTDIHPCIWIFLSLLDYVCARAHTHTHTYGCISTRIYTCSYKLIAILSTATYTHYLLVGGEYGFNCWGGQVDSTRIILILLEYIWMCPPAI